ncbi:CheR family methyltransferase [Sphingomonas sp.]|uniref:CheR family methyltransferase n=1 Tax=Sphingomonas sp. TaxID=28214 RepID=UPI0039C9C3CF
MMLHSPTPAGVPPLAPLASSSPSCSAASLAVLTDLLEARTGQQLTSYRAWRIDTALKPLVRERGLDTIDRLVTSLLEGHDRTIADRIVDALLNQETSFFRDGQVIDQVVEAVAAIEASGRRARVWSAGCATGQEPISLAIAFAERQERDGIAPPDIVATDVSEVAVARAREGRFTQFEIQRGLPVRRMIRWFDERGGDWIAKPELTRMIAFRRHNLTADAAPGRFDVVLCRNVLLYLAAPAKAEVFARIASALRPDGLLVLGAGETVIGQTSRFEPSARMRGFYGRARNRDTAAEIAA